VATCQEKEFMKDAAAVLISPFDGIWRALAAQANAWTTINKMLGQTIKLPLHLTAIGETLKTIGVNDCPGELFSLINESQELARDAIDLLSSQQQAIIYPGLVGSWAIVEAAFDDLILKILVNDPGVTNKLTTAGVKTAANHPVGTEPWAKELYKKVEAKAKDKAKGSVVEIHKACFSAFGIVLEYPADRARVIEEVNQARNCILHNQGMVDERAAKICPRLVPYLGSPIPPTDPLFSVALTMLIDYTTAWIAALIHSPYLRAGLLAGAKNPFSS
jgi:hypothetical protein